MSNPSNSSSAPRPGLSLYANLLDPGATTTAASVSRGPVVFKTGTSDPVEDPSAKKPQIDAAALRFQPTKRPQLAQKPKPKSQFPKAPLGSENPGSTPISKPPAPASARPAAKNTLADWTATGDDDDVNGFYGGGEKRQRGGRKRRKNKHREEHVAVQDWDDIYDPARPNNYEEYKHSDEKIREIREWKDRLYAHRMARKSESEKDSDEEDYRPPMKNRFAPPSNYSFAPPPMDSPPPKPLVDSGPESPARPLNQSPPPPPPAASLDTGSTVSRAPVRYNLPPAPSELPASEAELEKALAAEPEEEDEAPPDDEAPRSLRPGQKGFAERLMSKYGWSKGTGLGADGSGIVNPLRVQVEKRKKKSDAEGGGFRDPSGARGKIIGGKKNIPEKESEGGKFGPMSEVVVLRGMVDGMNLDEEVEGSGDGGLMQEIGEECDEKYGRVERVYIDRHGEKSKVFIKFTNQLSALRAVNALEGRLFNGNNISALFYNSEAFEAGSYDL
ncbi:hypothetical protein HYFRA_00007455 [Hymenoscyphus fraxineus]|uniref:G-patch domain-containing protein n=1 Tax=Hymenoscyphus fraxineus TaxID=746836 RepID=A0A9N9KPJ7_9HELO|nr:hypothetical protein HYFRA_00007455 [Hymenoscyphus fraxineus]